MLKKSLLAGLALGLAFATQSFAADPLKIVYIGKNTGNPYFDSITGGFQDACKQIGCEFEFVAPATAEATSITESRPNPISAADEAIDPAVMATAASMTL